MATRIHEIKSLTDYTENSILVYSAFDDFETSTPGNIYIGLKAPNGKGYERYEYVELDETKVEELLIAIQYAQLHSKTKGEMR